jgi:hypothetical protein
VEPFVYTDGSVMTEHGDHCGSWSGNGNGGLLEHAFAFVTTIIRGAKIPPIIRMTAIVTEIIGKSNDLRRGASDDGSKSEPGGDSECIDNVGSALSSMREYFVSAI